MRTAVAAVVIQDKQILLVRKRDTWIMPGGKPDPADQGNPRRTLERELTEELPDAKFEIDYYLTEFEGITPNTGDQLRCMTYMTIFHGGDIEPAAEIAEAKFVRDWRALPTSEITAKALAWLYAEGYLDG